MSKPRASKLFIEVYTDRMNELLDAELDGVPQAEISEAFDTRMNTLIERETKRRRQRIGIKRALIAAAAVTVLFLIACAAVPALRSSVAGFLFREYEDHIEYLQQEVMRERIDNEYGFVSLPDGYRCTGTTRIPIAVSRQYENASGEAISLQQTAAGAGAPTMNSNGSVYDKEIDGLKVLFIIREKSAAAAWVYDGYAFYLSCTGKAADEAFLTELIMSVAIVEN
ncbi:MAG: hypothetical protein IJM85_05915 [Clostridia bacterium]|nr:hypothetical protein [Clostridia bacterium]